MKIKSVSARADPGDLVQLAGSKVAVQQEARPLLYVPCMKKDRFISVCCD